MRRPTAGAGGRRGCLRVSCSPYCAHSGSRGGKHAPAMKMSCQVGRDALTCENASRCRPGQRGQWGVRVGVRRGCEGSAPTRTAHAPLMVVTSVTSHMPQATVWSRLTCSRGSHSHSMRRDDRGGGEGRAYGAPWARGACLWGPPGRGRRASGSPWLGAHARTVTMPGVNRAELCVFRQRLSQCGVLSPTVAMTCALASSPPMRTLVSTCGRGRGGGGLRRWGWFGDGGGGGAPCEPPRPGRWRGLR